MIPAILNNFIPIFIDETAINIDTQRIYSWIPLGEYSIIEKNSNVRSLTILGAMSPYGVIGYKVIKGFVDQYTFIGFLSELMESTYSEPNYTK